MKSNEIRTKFLDFFAARNHKIFVSDSLVPQNDPSVLFTSAGMNQFKPQFLGKITDFRRAASCQKCLRTADLEKVGVSPTHHTFFEMLGNFSFDDYFKKEAIAWAWEFIVDELKLPEERLWISVHKNDDEAYEIWTKKIHVSKDKIVKLGDKENFWPSNAPKDGPNGPCGPCSEIFYDWTEKYGCKKKNCNPACDCGRFTEIWNLVFTQYDRQPDGLLLSLPSKNIDTGMGLERITSVMQDKRENYQNDLFVPILYSLAEEIKRNGIIPAEDWLNTKAKTIADHIRAATFAISDGVIPSNEERGYVIRKLIRRSITCLKHIGIEKPFCYKLVFSISKTMQQPYPEVYNRHETIAGIIKKEEEMFWTIFNERVPQTELIFKELAIKVKNNTISQQAASASTATNIFIQYDTYGVPPEISKEIAKRYELPIEDEAVEKLINEQRLRSRTKTQLSNEIFAKNIGHLLGGIKSEFIGYEQLECEAKVMAILKDNQLINEAKTNDEVDIILDKTPFYAEAGGQVSDTGTLILNHSFLADVIGAKKVDEAILHCVKINKGDIKKDSKIKAIVDKVKRSSIARNHTATHLLQYALRKILGEHVEQSGSFVDSERLRFDFTHLCPLARENEQKIEEIVNECIWENYAVKTETMKFDVAKQKGALAFFQDKYADTVRVISIGNISQELCGGTHVRATGEIGILKIISESSIAQGIRRIEAVTGRKALELVQRKETLLEALTTLLKVPEDKLIKSIEDKIEQDKSQKKELEKLRLDSLAEEADKLIAQAKKTGSVFTVIAELASCKIDELRSIFDLIKNRLEPAVCVLASLDRDKPVLVVGISRSLSEKNLDAVKIIKEITGGIGGGRKELAQAGTKDKNSLKTMLEHSLLIIEKLLVKTGAVK